MPLGLLNRYSLLYRRKRDSGGYTGARWDSAREARGLEALPATLPWGGFLAFYLGKVTT